MNDMGLCPVEGDLRGLALCAGVGGLELGLHIALDRYRTVCYVEREAYAAAALVARMVDETLDRAPIWDDLATFDGKPWCGVVDIVTAGYPCQPFSQAGRRRGAADPRHLWPHVRRVINQVRPRLVFLENVPGHLTLGYPVVRGQLEALGFRVAEGIYSAAEVGGSQLRKRLFVLAVRDRFQWAGERLHAGSGEEGFRALDAGWLGEAVADDESGRRRVRLAGEGREAGVELDHRDQAVAGGADRQLPVSGRGSKRRNGAGQAGEAVAVDPGLRWTEVPKISCREGHVDNHGGEGLGSHSHLFAPRPTDHVAWLDFLSQRPEALPAVRRDADGLACRVDRLRAAGNRVVPLAAAFAFVSLAARLGLDLGDCGLGE